MACSGHASMTHVTTLLVLELRADLKGEYWGAAGCSDHSTHLLLVVLPWMSNTLISAIHTCGQHIWFILSTQSIQVASQNYDHEKKKCQTVTPVKTKKRQQRKWWLQNLKPRCGIQQTIPVSIGDGNLSSPCTSISSYAFFILHVRALELIQSTKTAPGQNQHWLLSLFFVQCLKGPSSLPSITSVWKDPPPYHPLLVSERTLLPTIHY